jgi:CBS domain containing-hemolysin-like protein
VGIITLEDIIEEIIENPDEDNDEVTSKSKGEKLR